MQNRRAAAAETEEAAAQKPGRRARALGLALGVLSFWLLDLTLRIATDSGAYYPIYAGAPNLFSLGFGALFAAIALLSPRWRGRVL